MPIGAPMPVVSVVLIQLSGAAASLSTAAEMAHWQRELEAGGAWGFRRHGCRPASDRQPRPRWAEDVLAPLSGGGPGRVSLRAALDL